MKRRRVLFVNPAYHYSFFLRDALRRRGWKADVLKNEYFPPKLLWDTDCLEAPKYPRRHMVWGALRRFWFLLRIGLSYDVFVVYGDAEVIVVIGRNNAFARWLTRQVPSPELAFLRMLGRKLVFFPNGCHQEVLRADFQQYEGGRVCANCGWAEGACDDRLNKALFDVVNRYHSVVIANTPMPSARVNNKRQIRFLGLDLAVYRPDLSIPDSLRRPRSNKIRIMHSFLSAHRTHGGKNVKGSPYIAAAIDRLIEEGLEVEYFYAQDVSLRDMRYLQVQADIIVDQLIYGWWGSTAIESMALGKPTVCYLNPNLKQLFHEAFPEYAELPIVEASTDTICDVLRALVIDPEYRERKGREARVFATRHFDAIKNAEELEGMLVSL